MKITALEIKQHEFEKSFRGYNIEEVDIFLNNLANEWERTSNEARMLRMQLEIAEKEAAKLREVEMSLIKTLQTAENTSNKITEQARYQAEKDLEESRLKCHEMISKARAESEEELANARAEVKEVLSNAQNEALRIVESAKQEVSESEKQLIGRQQNLESDITKLESYKQELVNQLKALTTATLSRLEALGVSTDKVEEKVVVSELVVERTIIEETTEEIKEEEEEIQGFASSANNLILEEEEEIQEESEIQPNNDDLTLIEGIGPKIDELLKNQGIHTFRDLATIPAYRVKELLVAAGPSYAMHDPGSWAEQARLASSEKWEELEALKDRLIAGRSVPQKETPAIESLPEIPLTGEQATEEMLDRVNKVKAALKKAMQEKASSAESAPEPPKEEKPSGSGSFFDNL